MLQIFHKPISNIKLVEEKIDGKNATLKLLTIKKVPDLLDGEPTHEEGTITLIREKGEWKIEHNSWKNVKEN